MDDQLSGGRRRRSKSNGGAAVAAGCGSLAELTRPLAPSLPPSAAVRFTLTFRIPGRGPLTFTPPLLLLLRCHCQQPVHYYSPYITPVRSLALLAF
jgi:hypothetical protein